MIRSRFKILSCIAMMLIANSAIADVRLPAVFSEHMVLQQQQKIRVWGWADVGESVTVTLGSNKETAKANASVDGKLNCLR